MIYRLCQLVGRICVMGILFLGPWRNGAFEPSYQRWLLYLVVVAAVSALLALWFTPRQIRKHNNYWPGLIVSIPLTLALALGVFQITPLSDGLMEKLSPHISQMKEICLPSQERQLTNEHIPNISTVNDPVLMGEEIEILERARLIDYELDENLSNVFSQIDPQDWGQTISVYPMVTRQNLPVFGAAFLLFLSVVILFNTNKARSFLLFMVTIQGVAFALICIALRSNPNLINIEALNLWWLKDSKVALTFGTYINKNAAAGYLVLCLGASLYFVALQVALAAKRERDERRNRYYEEAERAATSVYEFSRDSKWKRLLGDFFNIFEKKLGASLVVSGLLFASICASLSIGATISAFVVVVFVILGILFFQKEFRRLWFIPATILLVAFGTLIAVSKHEDVDARMSTLVEVDASGETAIESDIRWGNWKSALKTSVAYPWFGSGLGTYSLANYTNDEMTREGKLFYFAENTFVQTLLEMGRIGLILLLATYLFLVLMIARGLRGRHSVATTAFASSGIAVLVGQLQSSLTDFGIYLPANLFLFSMLCGIFVARHEKSEFEKLGKGRFSPKVVQKLLEREKKVERNERIGLVVISVQVVLLVCCSQWCFKENEDYITRRDLLRSASFSDEQIAYMKPEALDSLIEDFQSFTRRRDDCYEIRMRLANLLLARFRLGYKAQLVHEDPEGDERELWNRTQPDLYLRTLLDYQSCGMLIPVKHLRNNELVKNTFPEVTYNLFAARRICPMKPASYVGLLGTFPLASELTLEDERALAQLYIHILETVAPYDSMNLFIAGYRLGGYQLCGVQENILEKTMENTPTLAPQVLNVLNEYRSEAALKETVARIFPSDPAVLCQTVMSQMNNRNSPAFDAIVNRTRVSFESVQDSERDSAFYYWLGFFHNILGEYDLAVDSLKRAYDLDGENDLAFFLCIRILSEKNGVLGREQECVDMLEEYCMTHHGPKQWKASKLLEAARNNLLRTKARQEAIRSLKDSK